MRRYEAIEDLVVIADCIKEAITKFQRKYPNRSNDVLNCSFVYDEEHFEMVV